VAKYGERAPEIWRVAALDIESLSLKQDCVITEIGYVVAEVPNMNIGDILNHVKIVSTLKLDLLEQLSLGRSIDPKTIAWQEKQFGRDNYRDMVYGNPEKDKDFYYASDAINILKSDLKGMDEIWINHTSFDQGRLLNLAERLGIQGNLYDYRAEKDIYTLYTTLGLWETKEGETKATTAHRGAEDSLWNLSMYSRIAKAYEPIWVPNRGYMWVNKLVHYKPESARVER
jgi:hypothetical protein